MKLNKQFRYSFSFQSKNKQIKYSDEVSEQQLKRFIQTRINDVEQQSKLSQIPRNALIFGLLSISPLIIFPSLALASEQTLQLFQVVQYQNIFAIVNSTYAGMHIGYSMIENECQTDTENSTQSVKNHFILGCIPIVFSFIGLINFGYAPNLSSQIESIKIQQIIGTYLLGLDFFAVYKKIAPKWFLKLKIIVFMLQSLGFGLSYLYLQNDKIDFQKKDENRTQHIRLDQII